MRHTGTKTWISNGGIADFYTVFARTTEGITPYLVDAADVHVAERSDAIVTLPVPPRARAWRGEATTTSSSLIQGTT